MPKYNENYHAINVRTSWELFREMEEYRRKTGIAYNSLYNISVKDYLDRVNSRKKENEETA